MYTCIRVTQGIRDERNDLPAPIMAKSNVSVSILSKPKSANENDTRLGRLEIAFYKAQGQMYAYMSNSPRPLISNAMAFLSWLQRLNGLCQPWIDGETDIAHWSLITHSQLALLVANGYSARDSRFARDTSLVADVCQQFGDDLSSSELGAGERAQPHSPTPRH
jgi:hypothetical protein